MAVGKVDDAPVAVVVGVRTARVRGLRTGAARGEPLQGHTGRVDAVAAGEVDRPRSGRRRPLRRDLDVGY